MSRSKARAQQIHFQTRSRQRAGFEIGKAGQDEIVRMIRGKAGPGRHAVFLRRQSLRVTIWRVVYNDAELVVVYDSVRGTVVTVLPEAAVAS